MRIIYDEPTEKTGKELSLRDLLALSAIDAAYHHCRKTGTVEARRIARYAYDLADAMLEERKQVNDL